MTTTPERPARAVDAQICYLAPGSHLNRRFVAPGVEHNTGRYLPYPVKIEDGRPISDRFTLDTHGFVLAHAPSMVGDFLDKAEVEQVYPAEAAATLKALTGAAEVAPLGWMVRTSGDLQRPAAPAAAGYTHQGGIQPPAGEAHVDMMPDRAENLARTVYARHFPEGKGYSRFLAVSLWRTFSAPPQDMPLAVCDARSVGREEGVPNTMFIVDALPSEEAMRGEMPDEDKAPAAAIFFHNPAHRWWYFSNMTRDEVLLFKFHDSDSDRAMRTPHTAFHDPSFPDAQVRESIECRLIAYFP